MQTISGDMQEIEIIDVPYYPCTEMQKITGVRPFPLVEDEEFIRQLSGYTCADVRSVEFWGNFIKGQGFGLQISPCHNSSAPNSVVCKDS